MDHQLQEEGMENGKENEKQKLEAELAQVEILLSRINELEAKAQANSSNPHNDEGSGERSSSQAEMPGKPMGAVAFTKERSAVGARMTVASSSSDLRAGQKREAEEAIVQAKRVKPMSPASSRHTHSTLHSSDETTSAQGGNENPRDDVWEKALEVLSDMKKTCPEFWAYESPVVERWPSIREEYERVIDNPMDIGIVRDRILNRFYDSPYGYQSDVKLTFQNAMKFNAKESTYYVAASKLLKQFNNRFRTVDRMWKNPGYVSTKGRQGKLKKRVTIVEPKAKELTPEEESDAPAPETDSEPEAEPAELEPELEPPPPLVKRAQPVAPAMRKPGNQVRGRNKKTVQWSARPEVKLNPRLGRSTHSNAYGGVRDLTEREKRKLTMLVVKFPPDRTRKVLAIIKERNPGMDTNEVIDLDALDRETQFELWKLAMNWQKSRNKAHNRKYREESEGPQLLNTESADVDIMGLDEDEEDEDAAAALKLQQSKEGDASSSSESESGSDSSDSENTSGDSSESDESDAESEKDVDVDSDKG